MHQCSCWWTLRRGRKRRTKVPSPEEIHFACEAKHGQDWMESMDAITTSGTHWIVIGEKEGMLNTASLLLFCAFFCGDPCNNVFRLDRWNCQAFRLQRDGFDRVIGLDKWTLESRSGEGRENGCAVALCNISVIQ